MSTPTPAEIKAALDVLERLRAPKKYRRSDLVGMDPRAVAAILDEQPDAFDHLEQDES